MTADRKWGTRLAKAREEIAEALRTSTPLTGWQRDLGAYALTPHQAQDLADAVLALPALRAAGEGDRLLRDLAALAEEFEADGWNVDGGDAAARIRALLDGGEGGR